MKALVCEMCQSNELVKQDGYYVCQHCGTKYTVEEARKLMVEGTVKVDNTEKINNLYQLARQSKITNSYGDMAKYYGAIREECPNDWEAMFYSVIGSARNCKIIAISSAATSIRNVFPSVMEAIESHAAEKEDAAYEVINEAIDTYQMLYLGAKSHYLQFFDNKESGSESFARLSVCFNALLAIDESIPDTASFTPAKSERIKKLYIKACTTAQKMVEDYYDIHYNKYPSLATSSLRTSYQTLIDLAENKIQLYDSTHTKPELRSSSPSTAAPKSGGGCYVATAVYGSYDFPQVWTLRRFRDYTLAETWYGRAFIRTYYAISPTLVKWFGKTEWFKSMWKPTLDRMVERLNSEGVENTPYNDRNW